MSRKRAGFAVLAWGAATATAMAVVWAGLDSVLPATVEGPHVATVAAWPVQIGGSAAAGATGASAPSSSAAAAPSAAATHAAGKASASGSAAAGSTSAGASPSASAASSAAGSEKRYTTAGGTAVLTLYPDHAVLDAAIPDSGFSARSWTNTDMLEVEFSPSGSGTVYEVIATWNGTSPQVNTYAVGG
ncbi:hypothetical protein KDK95_03225 [Actinospica sp. MGRD01-02]|uniref:Secreted protein n=1 Tax=Actinospica acidithermotolerans TaxID=2828514 RepID=A0A941E341_9ACTN|nr:hypothetical protein [Actinospica acidithermotolerans]MBR7825305.1 hypothetical protein [Actinospica acidithermotolerans]